MLTLPAPIADAERAVHHHKHDLLVRVMAHIVRCALVQTYVFAGDVPEDIVAKADRQGVASNAWNALRSLQIIEALPLTFNDPDKAIFAGRKQNQNGGAKGRWVSVYRLRSRSHALTWASQNGIRLAEAEIKRPVQVELLTD
jgi:hypothetical protein